MKKNYMKVDNYNITKSYNLEIYDYKEMTDTKKEFTGIGKNIKNLSYTAKSKNITRVKKGLNRKDKFTIASYFLLPLIIATSYGYFEISDPMYKTNISLEARVSSITYGTGKGGGFSIIVVEAKNGSKYSFRKSARYRASVDQLVFLQKYKRRKSKFQRYKLE